MQDGRLIVAALLVLVVLVAFILPMMGRDRKEGFGVYEAALVNRNVYIDEGQNKYNKMAQVMDPTVRNMGGTNPENVRRVSEAIASAMSTATLEPDVAARTFLGVARDSITAELPRPNALFEEAKKCEALRGRDACAKLGTPAYANCGICVKGGSPYTYENPDKHIGGLLVLPDDRKAAERRRGEYYASVGSCPAGNFFVNKDLCIKQSNRMDCREIGETGGFNGGRTAEGKQMAREKCVQAPAAGESVFIYEPKKDGFTTRPYTVTLRVLAPPGTGVIRVHVHKNISGRMTQVAFGENRRTGTEMRLTIPNARELDTYTVTMYEEVAYRRTGKREVFLFKSPASEGESQTFNNAVNTCNRIGGRIATKAELEEAWSAGAQTCHAGWAANADGTPFAGYPRQAFNPNGQCGPNTSGGRLLVDTGNKNDGNVWCYGIRPPQNAFPFFGPESQIGVQASVPQRLSFHGDDYQAPYLRAILAQWEISNGGQTRVVPFQPTIVRVNGQNPSNIASDGTKTFKVIRNYGTFAKSGFISLRPTAGSKLLTNMSWIWSNMPLEQQTKFDIQIPGIFLDPFYPEDRAIAPRGPLIARPETATLMRTSPCLKEDQVAGKYGIDCLSNLFVGSGGDIAKGKLAIENGGLSQLNTLGDMDKISEYLNNLYMIATTGRDAAGNKVGGNDARTRTNEINKASQALFGFDVATPCEDVAEDATGKLLLVPKSLPLDSWCLDYLWLNTNSDRDRGNEEGGRLSNLRNTYTSIADRYSGLRNNEGNKQAREAAPFQTCQRTGAYAPINADGNPNPEAIRYFNSMGSVEKIQAFMDSVHKGANYTNPDAAKDEISKDFGIKFQANFVDACYGVKRNLESDDKTCGVLARYVRVLPNGIFGASNTDSLCLQISQIQVFDAKGTELAKGMPTRSSPAFAIFNAAQAVDGRAYPKPMNASGGGFHAQCAPDNTFWMVDLGAMKEVSEVRFFQRSDAFNIMRQLSTPVQLLDDSYNVVAIHYVGEKTWPSTWRSAPEVMKFITEDAQPQIPLADLVPDTAVALLSATSWSRYIFANGAATGLLEVQQTMNYSSAPDLTTFTIQASLNNRPGFISFRSLRGSYLRHSGFRLWAHNNDGSGLFANDASFKIVPALNGSKAFVSLESANFPGYYIATHRESPTSVWITPVQKDNAYDVQRVCWRINNPIA